MFNLICYCLLVLISFHTSRSVYISADTIERLKKGEWVIYPHDDNEERMVKIVKSSSILGNKDFLTKTPSVIAQTKMVIW
ncbi:hypothetical protein TELCIR_25782 [Teladorsagia circumcincta]|uniref:Uncharacterized protein n=1 Tax=Teladorsagia circumcincta TaxID=45464 RepID=A0A2G9T4K8_TELCI|nr:hypothetical protein TELCIR_25782 [Teladorsagia circumcincta]